MGLAGLCAGLRIHGMNMVVNAANGVRAAIGNEAACRTELCQIFQRQVISRYWRGEIRACRERLVRCSIGQGRMRSYGEQDHRGAPHETVSCVCRNAFALDI